MRKYLIASISLLMATFVGLSGCGGVESHYGDQPKAGIAQFVVNQTSGAIWAPEDDSIKELTLRISPDYNPDDNTINVYLVALDQDGNQFETFNKYNFSITVDGGTGSRPVDLTDPAVQLSPVVGSNLKTVALGLDNSGSMSWEDPVTGLTSEEILQEAASLYVDKMQEGEKAAIVQFSTKAITLQPVTDNKDKLQAAIDKLEPDAATNIGGAIIKCAENVQAYPGKTAAVIMTDGGDTEGFIEDGIKLARDLGLPVFTIGLGTGVYPYDLERIAQRTGGQYFPAESSNLAQIFAEVIPAAIDALPSRRSMRLLVPNVAPVPQSIYEDITVNVTVTLTFENARKVHRAVSSGTFVVAR